MSLPRIGKFTTSTILWSDGTNFNGYLWVGFVLPQYSSVDVASINWSPFSPKFQLPLVGPFPIVDGKFNTAQGLQYNLDLQPPNNKYVLRYYDTNRHLVCGPSATFTVSTDPCVLPSCTLTVPTAGTHGPTPDAIIDNENPMVFFNISTDVYTLAAQTTIYYTGGVFPDNQLFVVRGGIEYSLNIDYTTSVDPSTGFTIITLLEAPQIGDVIRITKFTY